MQRFYLYPLHVLDRGGARVLLGTDEVGGDVVKQQFVRDARRLNVAAVGRPVCLEKRNKHSQTNTQPECE